MAPFLYRVAATGALVGVGIPSVLYLTFLGLGIVPFFQREFLYSHRIHTLFWHNVNNPQYWGFAKNQVTPFSLNTADAQEIYAWHILPLSLYSRHEDKLISQPLGFCKDFTKTENFKLLRDDPKARLVIYFHGNAGHIAQNIRPASYHVLTDTSSYHVLAIDYRGFGHSTGVPSEEGLILDASAAVDFALREAQIPPERIVLLGQSLGTTVTSGVAERYAQKGVDFGGVVLVASFSSLPDMLSGYAIAGRVPILLPMRYWPWLLKKTLSFLTEKWPTKDRVHNMVRTVKARGGRLRLNLIHAKNDWDIPSYEDDKTFLAAVSGLWPEEKEIDAEWFADEKARRRVEKGEDAFVAEWKEDGVTIRQELFPYGGHNDIMMYAPVTLSIMRAFKLEGTAYEDEV